MLNNTATKKTCFPELNAEHIRKRTIELSLNSGAGHLAPSLSTVEMLTVLFRDFMYYSPDNVHLPERDRLIFSKGHGAYAYYIILNELGILPNEELDNFYSGASIKGCLTQNAHYMIEASTGSLGHGLPIAVGMAQAFKMLKQPQKVICIVGDGEMQEGSNFEALGLAVRFKLDNLLLIVDANQLQAMDRVDDVAIDNTRLYHVLKAYTDNTLQVDGHNESALKSAMHSFFKQPSQQFSAIVCHTLKGKGVPLCEDTIAYHYRCPAEDGYTLEDNND